MLIFGVLILGVLLVMGAPPERRPYMLKAAGSVAFGFLAMHLLITQTALMVTLAAIAAALYGLHRIVHSHNAHVRVLEQNRKSGPLAYIRWLLNP
jgi:hypothetical protein